MISTSPSTAGLGHHPPPTPSANGLRLRTGSGTGPSGPLAAPRFFEGAVTHPEVVARGLLAVAAVARSRYPAPLGTVHRDPVVTADGTCLRFESFSACCGVHARLDLLPDGLVGDTVQRGTVNVDVGVALQRVLALVVDGDPLRLAVGPGELAVTTPTAAVVEPEVALPPRWLRGFAEVAVSLAGTDPRAEVSPTELRRVLRTLPRSAAQQVLWVVPTGRGVRLSTRAVAGAVCVAGPRRLEALEPLLPLATAVRLHGPTVTGRAAASAWEVLLPGARFTLALSPGASRGFSGEGGVLEAPAAEGVDEDADRVLDLLAWAPGLPAEDVADALDLTDDRVRRALVVLGTSGLVGYDLATAAWFHRELPFRGSRVERVDPRLRAARALVAEGAVAERGDGTAVVRSENGERLVRQGAEGSSCTCRWWFEHTGARGPCRHVLAVQIARRDRAGVQDGRVGA